MKVTRVDAPGPAQIQGLRINESGSDSPRERAIQALIQNAKASHTEVPSQQVSSPAPEPVMSSPSPAQESIMQASSAQSEPLAAAVAAAQAPSSPPSSSSSLASPVSETNSDNSESKLAARYAQLAQREKALRAREAQIKAQEDKFNKSTALPVEQKQDLSRYIDKDSLKKDPFKHLLDIGLGYEELTNLALNQPSPQDLAAQNKITSLESKIAELEGKLNSTHKQFEDTQQSQRQQAVAQISRDVKSLVDLNPEFETIKAAGAYSAVVKLIEKTFDEEGIMLDNEEAAREIEKTLFDKYTKIAQINKIKSQFASVKEAAAAAASKPEESKKPEQQQIVKTLTNATSPSRKLTRTERAILAFKGQLNE